MAKRDEAAEEQDAAEERPDATELVEAAEERLHEQLVEEARDLGLTKREAERAVKRQEPIPYTWRGMTRYRCPLCPADRDTAAEVEAHMADRHPPDGPTELQQMTAAESAAREESGNA